MKIYFFWGDLIHVPVDKEPVLACDKTLFTSVFREAHYNCRFGQVIPKIIYNY